MSGSNQFYQNIRLSSASTFFSRTRQQRELFIEQLKMPLRDFLKSFKSIKAKINPSPIIVLGNQKSGTSAVAHLLADFSGLTKTIDIRELASPYFERLVSGKTSLHALANRHKYYFAAELIKEPNLGFFYSDLKALHPAARYVMVVREPASNIRSILNRVGLTGSTNDRSFNELEIPFSWHCVFDPNTLGLTNTASYNYVELLAHRWNLFADLYLNNAQDMLLLRYEDFCLDKLAAIQRIALVFGFEQRNDIDNILDKQFQPKGNSSATPLEFFGEDNLDRILTISGKRMSMVGYSVMSQGSPHIL